MVHTLLIGTGFQRRYWKDRDSDFYDTTAVNLQTNKDGHLNVWVARDGDISLSISQVEFSSITVKAIFIVQRFVLTLVALASCRN